MESSATQREVLGVSIDALTMPQTVARCVDSIESGGYLPIAVVNAAKIVRMRHDAELREAVHGCGMVLADGQSVVWASCILGLPLPERVAGIDLFMELLAEAQRRSYRVYFIGARPDVLDRMLNEVSRRFPDLNIAGASDGYYEAHDEAKIAESVRLSNAHILFLGMSSPKKEVFLSRWGTATGVSVIHGVGGSFDVLAGLKKRAPAIFQKLGLEWLYRAAQEPIRLGRRYIATNMIFTALVVQHLIRLRLDPPEIQG